MISRTRVKINITKRIFKVPADGGCLFHSVAFGIYYHNKEKKPTKYVHQKRLSAKLRVCVCQYLKSYLTTTDGLHQMVLSARDLFPKQELLRKSDISIARKYIKHLEKKCSWGGFLEIDILSRILKNKNFKGLQVVQSVDGKESKIYENVNLKKRKAVVRILLKNSNHFDFIV
jgi:hypothetical protein